MDLLMHPVNPKIWHSVWLCNLGSDVKTFCVVLASFYCDSSATKCGITGSSAFKGLEVALGGIKCVNLEKKEILKILAIHFSYNKKPIKERITVFKWLAFS